MGNTDKGSSQVRSCTEKIGTDATETRAKQVQFVPLLRKHIPFVPILRKHILYLATGVSKLKKTASTNRLMHAISLISSEIGGR